MEAIIVVKKSFLRFCCAVLRSCAARLKIETATAPTASKVMFQNSRCSDLVGESKKPCRIPPVNDANDVKANIEMNQGVALCECADRFLARRIAKTMHSTASMKSVIATPGSSSLASSAAFMILAKMRNSFFKCLHWFTPGISDGPQVRL